MAIWGPLCEQKWQKTLHHRFRVRRFLRSLVSPRVVVAPFDSVASLLETLHASFLVPDEFVGLAALWLWLLLYGTLIDLALLLLGSCMIHQHVLIRLTRSVLPFHE